MGVEHFKCLSGRAIENLKVFQSVRFVSRVVANVCDGFAQILLYFGGHKSAKPRYVSIRRL